MSTATREHSEHGLLAIADPFPRDRAASYVELHDEHGQAFAEYGLILALVVLVAAASLSPLGAGLGTLVGDTVNAVVALL